MLIANPPWTLEPMLRDALPYLTDALAHDSGANFTIESSNTAKPPVVRSAPPRRNVR